tara:strand:+ start:735 stop:1622 length:888 start_codon:yes stop_codon:yes gene_type:complete
MGLDYKKKYLKYKNKYLEAKKIYGGSGDTDVVDHDGDNFRSRVVNVVGIIRSIRYTDNLEDNVRAIIKTLKSHDEETLAQHIENLAGTPEPHKRYNDFLHIFNDIENEEKINKLYTIKLGNVKEVFTKIFEQIRMNSNFIKEIEESIQSEGGETKSAALPTDDDSSQSAQDGMSTPAVEALAPVEPPNMDVLGTISQATAKKAADQVRKEVEELLKDMTKKDKKFANAFIEIKNKLEKTAASSNLENLFTDCDILKNLLFELLEKPQEPIENKKEAATKALENVNRIITTLEAEK